MKDVVKFLFEVGMLKRIKRSGWWAEGIKDPESVADHVTRMAMLGYILAKMEKADADKVVKMCLFHETGECRISDLHKVAKKYIDIREAEAAAVKDQMASLPLEIGKELQELYTEFDTNSTKEAVIARDADYLECAIQAKEYAEQGHEGCLYWIKLNGDRLRTESAKKLRNELVNMTSTDWWKGLENMHR